METIQTIDEIPQKVKRYGKFWYYAFYHYKDEKIAEKRKDHMNREFPEHVFAIIPYTHQGKIKSHSHTMYAIYKRNK
jgi:hypothetical protein